MVKCSRCGFINQEDTRICSQCGLGDPPLFCGNCHNVLDLRQNKCLYCGVPYILPEHYIKKIHDKSPDKPIQDLNKYMDNNGKKYKKKDDKKTIIIVFNVILLAAIIFLIVNSVVSKNKRKEAISAYSQSIDDAIKDALISEEQKTSTPDTTAVLTPYPIATPIATAPITTGISNTADSYSLYVDTYEISNYRFDFYEGKYRTTVISGPGLDRFILDENSGWADPNGNTWYRSEDSSISMYDDWEEIVQYCLQSPDYDGENDSLATNENIYNEQKNVPLQRIYSQASSAGEQTVQIKFGDGGYYISIYRFQDKFNVLHSSGYSIASQLNSGDSFTYGNYTFYVYYNYNNVGHFYVDVYE